MRGDKMKKKKLKPFVKISLIAVVLLVGLIGVTVLVNNKTISVSNIKDDFTYVNDYIFDNYYPVVNEDEKIIKPYTDETVSVYRTFYDKDAKAEDQKKSIIYHEGIYMQNSGIDYKSDKEFDVVASLSGTVTNVTDDTLLGKTVEVRNSSEIIVLYQSLKDVSVKKGDTIAQGQIIGKSGTSTLNGDVKNGLHFEMYKNGGVLNPELYFDKSIKELSNN